MVLLLPPSPSPVNMLSIIVPARDEPYLNKTVEELLANAAGDVEIVVVFDGWGGELPADKRIKKVYFKPAVGIREAIRAGVQKSRGEYIMKIDAHCRIGEGYDEILKADCADNWIVTPTQYGLDAEDWERKQTPCDAMYLLYPYITNGTRVLTYRPWQNRTMDRRNFLIDEDMGMPGSCYLMTRKHWNRIDGLSKHPGYGTWKGEPEELTLKTQLGPWEGSVMRNKKTWYAHWTKPRDMTAGDGKLWHVPEADWWKALDFMYDYWWNNQWQERAHDMEWLIDKWMPLPKWPADWRGKCLQLA